MTVFNIIALLITLAAGLSYVNHRFVKLPVTIGLMLISFLMSLGIILIGNFYPAFTVQAQSFLNQIDFNETLLNGMLSFLLFAGALHINLNDLKKQKWVISFLATIGVLFSTFVIGSAMHTVFDLMGLSIPFIYCLLFGSLISPTDPIAVLGILKQAKAPKALETKIAGESLFNDGVGVVIFLVLLALATQTTPVTAADVIVLFAQEALGGIALGFLLGWLFYVLLKSVDNYQVEILLTLALTFGGYALALGIHTSGPIAIVVAGLFIGNHGRDFAMSDHTKEHLDSFWELIDEILNAVLFVLIGLDVLVLTVKTEYLIAGLIAIPVCLLARFLAIAMPVLALKKVKQFSPGTIRIMTWAGLRGGISIALALSLPSGVERDLLLTTTYVVVLFSIAVQGLTIKKLVMATTEKS